MPNEQKRWLTSTALLVALIASPVILTQASSLLASNLSQDARELSAATVRAIFAPVVNDLKKRTRVPVRVPTRLPGVTTEEPQLYAMIDEATAAGYAVDIDFDPQCMGATACHHGAVYAHKMTPRNSRLRGKAVRLTKGMTGYFTDAFCGGAGCGESKLSWKQDAAIYTVAIKAGRLKELVSMANSMIGNGPL
jgi:hypothetical protein